MYGQSRKHPKKQQCMDRAGNIIKKQQCMDRAGNILKNNNVWTEQETS